MYLVDYYVTFYEVLRLAIRFILFYIDHAFRLPMFCDIIESMFCDIIDVNTALF